MNTTTENFKVYLKALISDETLYEFIPDILKRFAVFTLEKNDYFVLENEICSYFCFIESGVLQHAIPLMGEEKTTYLALKNSCTSALKSFLHQKPSRKNIKALTNCVLLTITINDFEYLIQHNKAFYSFYHNLIERQIFLIDDHRIDLLTLSPEERYSKLLTNEPELLQTIPLHYLASFLGISKRHMSRIRKNIK